MDMKGIEEKGWGHELIWADTETYCGKLLVFKDRGNKFSMHFHKEKDETWFVQDGEFTLRWIDTVTATTYTEKLKVGDTWRNKPLVPHQLIAEMDNSKIIEVSTADSVEDNYRVAPGDSQL